MIIYRGYEIHEFYVLYNRVIGVYEPDATQSLIFTDSIKEAKAYINKRIHNQNFESKLDDFINEKKEKHGKKT